MRVARTIVSALFVAALAATAHAQPAGRGPDRGPRLDREKVTAAWTLEAKGVAAAMELPAEQTTQLTSAYLDCRQRLHEARSALREEFGLVPGERRHDRAVGQGQGQGRGQGKARGNGRGRGLGAADGDGQGKGLGRGAGDRPGRRGMSEQEREEMRAFRERSEAIASEERAVFGADLAAFLNEAQATRALSSLGTFHRGWDGMVIAVADLGLDEQTLMNALVPIEAYHVTVAKVRGTRDREAMRAARETLRKNLEEILNPEQMEKLAQTMPDRGPRGRRGPGPGPGPGPESIR